MSTARRDNPMKLQDSACRECTSAKLLFCPRNLAFYEIGKRIWSSTWHGMSPCSCVQRSFRANLSHWHKNGMTSSLGMSLEAP
jgi:hypothetical protein